MEYTAHVQVPDAAIGAALHYAILDKGAVSCVTMRSGNGTWLSFGIMAESDDNAVMAASSVRYHVSGDPNITIPPGYDKDSITLFETAPMIITSGRTVIYSEGI